MTGAPPSLESSHPLESGVPPGWASAWGDSKYGPWAAFEVGGVEQRMSWIPAGTFWMGSPDDEPGRFDDEVRHLVTLTEGFWMAQTPVTQALWEVVMASNPSEFVDPLRPVENVSWEDARAFVQRVNERHPGLELRLPTEAQWERACRAGTDTATHAGPIEIRGDNDAPILNAIAWYGGNSGHDWDREDGFDSSSWPKKQYPHHRAGTRRVKTRRPNPWGLYDTLGNVWEWTADWYGDSPRTSLQEPVGDPTGPDVGSERVLRGGSWSTGARGVRAALRDAGDPAYRDPNIGFRLSRGRGAPGQPAARGRGR